MGCPSGDRSHTPKNGMSIPRPDARAQDLRFRRELVRHGFRFSIYHSSLPERRAVPQCRRKQSVNEPKSRPGIDAQRSVRRCECRKFGEAVSAPAVLRTLPSHAVSLFNGMDVVSVITFSKPCGSTKMVCRSGRGPGTQPSLEIDAKARPAYDRVMN